jgi:4-amino-4-deoxy-L-arabinose transferase-like glycosyltransferase
VSRPGAAAPELVRVLARDSRVHFAAVLLLALALRSVFFVGFALGDDLGYIGHVTQILDGRYPPLDPLNQYAYRPLLLYLFAAGIAIFGFTDLGVAAPVMMASIATVAIIYTFVRRLVDPDAALWCALLFACQPFNVVNSTTMTNDVILSCLMFGAVALFLLADDERNPRKMRRLFVAAAAVLTSAFLVKMTLVPALCALGLYSVASLRSRASTVWRGHVVFYVAFLIGLACICAAYYLKTGDPFWQFRSELHYYETYKPDWYLRGDINYAQLMWEYPISLFGLSGYGSFRYLDHGLLFWLFVPAALWAIVSRNHILSFLVLLTVTVFLFFQFYPQYLTPRYLPLVRQTRYLEQLLPAAVIVVGTALCQVWRRQRILSTLVLILLVGDFVYEASRRSFLFDDSQQDMRALANYATATLSHTRQALEVDTPAKASLQFHLRGRSIALSSLDGQPPVDSYVAVGGARSFWWARDLVFDVRPEDVPPHWVLAYEVAGRQVPWRPSDLRVYYVGALSPDASIFSRPLRADSGNCQSAGLREVPYTAGFERSQAPPTNVGSIPEVDNGTAMPAAHMEWTAFLRSDEGIYTFETMSDDGSWIYLNDELVLDNGGTHPAKRARHAVHLRAGWYSFKLRYENTGGDQFLRFRLYRGAEVSPAPDTPSFCLELPVAGSAPSR